MLEHQPEIRRALAAERAEGMRRAATGSSTRHLRRTIGSGLVRLGLRLAPDGDFPPFGPQLPCQEEAPVGVSSIAFSKA